MGGWSWRYYWPTSAPCMCQCFNNFLPGLPGPVLLLFCCTGGKRAASCLPNSSQTFWTLAKSSSSLLGFCEIRASASALMQVCASVFRSLLAEEAEVEVTKKNTKEKQTQFPLSCSAELRCEKTHQAVAQNPTVTVCVCACEEHACACVSVRVLQ